MRKKDRDMASRLETVMTAHAARQVASDARALAELAAVGFHLDTIDEAYERLEAQRDLPGFTQAQIDVVIYKQHHTAQARATRGTTA